MFVVHSVNQLEEATRVGAREILVTGRIAGNVRDIFSFKTCRSGDVCPFEGFSGEELLKIEEIAQHAGVPACQIISIMIVTGDYSLLDDPQSPLSTCMLQRQRTTPEH